MYFGWCFSILFQASDTLFHQPFIREPAKQTSSIDTAHNSILHV